MRSVTHQVGHLVREIDTAMIGMLGSVTSGREPKNETDPLDDEDRRRAVDAVLQAFKVSKKFRANTAKRLARDLSHGREGRTSRIRSVLDTLGIAADDPMRRAWISPSRGAQVWAHRNQLLPPRPLDQEFLEFWEGTQDAWLAVLERFETRFTDSFPLIDRLLAVERPEQRHVTEFQEGVPNTYVTYQRFFGGMTDVRWLNLLRRKHIFDHPPAPEDNEVGARFVPSWPQSRLLARIAASDPKKVKDVILAVPPTENVNVHADFAETALRMPAPMAAEITPKATEGLGSPDYAASLVRGLAALVAHLAQGGLTQEAIGLAHELLALVPKEEEEGVLLVTRDPDPRFRPPELYGEIVEISLGPLVDAAGERAFAMLCGLLEDAIGYSTGHYSAEGDGALPRRDGLYVLRPTIEDSSYNHDYGPLGEVAIYRLLTAVRDASVRITEADSSAVPRLVEELESRKNETFERLALNLLRTAPDVPDATTLIAERLKGRMADFTPGLFHEYTLLLREHFERLSPEDRRVILRLIGHGPSEDELSIMREYAASDDSYRGPLTGENLEAYVERHAERWKLRLYRVLNEFLSDAERAEYEWLAARHPDLLEGDPFFYTDPRVLPIPRHGSPESAENLRVMPIEEVVSFLRDFEPADDWEGPDVRDVAGELHEAVAADPSRFAAEAEKFRGLDPSYVQAIVWGLRDGLPDEDAESSDGDDKMTSARSSPRFQWGPVLSLCRWVLDQPRGASEEQYAGVRDIGWGLSRRRIGELLNDALRKQEEIPFDLREEVWAVLQPLSEDPEPTLAYEEDERRLAGPEATPHAWAINTVRGVAMRAVVAYALWARRNVGGDSWRGLADASEAREVLERRLDRTVDPTRTIRSVYGSGLPLLIYLDRAWVEERLPLIFPEDERDAQLREAAWESYLLDWIPYDDVFEVVRDEYARAVEHLAPDRELRSPRDPDGFLARHLMILLWRGTVSFGDPDGILETFYTRASDTLRARAAGFVGRELRRREGQVPPQQLARLEDLWERRLASAAEDREKPATEELGAFAWFFLSGKFDETAALERLDRALDLGADVGRDIYSVVAGLADAAPRHPGLAVKCVDKIARKILERPDPATPILSIANNARHILLAARGGADEQARQAAEDLANMLISHNYRYFQAVLEG